MVCDWQFFLYLKSGFCSSGDTRKTRWALYNQASQEDGSWKRKATSALENHWIGKLPPFPTLLRPEPLMMADFGSILETPHPGLLLIFIELLAQRHFHQSTLRAGHTLSHTGAPWKELQLQSSPRPELAHRNACGIHSLPQAGSPGCNWRERPHQVGPAKACWGTLACISGRKPRLDAHWPCAKQASNLFTYFISFNPNIIPIVQMKKLRLGEAK